MGMLRRLCLVAMLINRPADDPWMLQYALRWSAEAHERVFDISYAMVRRLLPIVASHLGMEDIDFTSHGFRKGGASYILDQAMPIMNIAEVGRFARVKCCVDVESIRLVRDLL